MSEAPQNHLLIIEDEQGRREFVLDRPTYSLGRDPKCDLRLASQFVSRHHATLVQLPQEDGRFFYRIVDGSLDGKPSANGLLINGRKLQVHDLKNQDEVVFGPQVRAIYYLLRRDSTLSTPPDEFDITLISPNMMDDLEELPSFEDEDSSEGDITTTRY
jgi:pSer/pThr/pTyr-binding forkhead associated (FHA) protein